MLKILSNSYRKKKHESSPNDSIDCADGVEAGPSVVFCGLKLGNAVVVVEGAVVVMVADVDALETVVVVAVVAAPDDNDGTTVKLKPPVEEASAGIENNDPDVAGAAMADVGVSALVPETEAKVGVEAADDEPNGKLRELADELAATLVLENNEGAVAACEVAKEKLVDGVEDGMVEAAEVLFEKEKAGAEDADENKDGVLLAVVVLVDDGVKPNDGAEAAAAGDDDNPNDGVVVAVVAGDDVVLVLKSGAEVVDPNSVEPVLAPNPRAGAEAEVEVVLDEEAPVFKPKPKDGAEAAVVVVVVPDVDEAKPKPVEAPENRFAVDAAEAAAPSIPGVVAAEVAPKTLDAIAGEEVAPNKPGAVAAAEAAPNKPGVVAGEEVAPNKLVVDAAEDAVPNMLGVVAAAGAVDVADAAEEGGAVDWPNEKPVDPKPKEEVEKAAAEAGDDPKRDEPKVGAEETAEEENGEEPKAGPGEGEGVAAGWENEKADGAVEKKGEEPVDPAAAADEPNANEVAMAASGKRGGRFGWEEGFWFGYWGVFLNF
ncbi:hypothetical protein GUJ93_ZPchr0007g5201 [Zizania palustris]|uniref:Uncharacterized protein n=1 Tax=Zizania palustris TaxID=103762 RepID=A0A8J5T8Z9_ZIZPA|nr:hypothetical protein GUJ93_ZPchr0007g5201 [Zizania palustris]